MTLSTCLVLFDLLSGQHLHSYFNIPLLNDLPCWLQIQSDVTREKLQPTASLPKRVFKVNQYTCKLNHHEILHTGILSRRDTSKPMTACSSWIANMQVFTLPTCAHLSCPKDCCILKSLSRDRAKLSACLSRPRHESSQGGYCHVHNRR